MKRILSIAVLLSLTSCAQPQTMGPTASAQEIAKETQIQEAYVREARTQGLIIGGTNSKPVRPRLQAVASRIAPAAVKLCRDLGFANPDDCAYSIHLSSSSGEDAINAYADGKDVYFSSAMVRYTETDDELALVAAHEYAHNIMGHVNSSHQNALVGALLGAVVDAAAASQSGYYDNSAARSGAVIGTLVYSPAFEHEVDYLGVYLTARAGYNYKNVAALWRRMSLANPDSIYFGTTHPTHPDRYVVINKTVAEIDAKKKAHEPLIPKFKSNSDIKPPTHKGS